MRVTTRRDATIARRAARLSAASACLTALAALSAASGLPAAEVQGTPSELLQSARPTMDLAKGFVDPPRAAKPRVYWWWLNSRVTRDAITRDLEQLAAKGIGGVLLFDAGGPAGPVPPGPAFLSEEWRALFRHAVREAARVDLEMSVNLCSGWDAGGPWVSPADGCRRVAWSAVTWTGPGKRSEALPLPPGVSAEHFVDVAAVAFPAREDGLPGPKVTASSSQARYPVAEAADEVDETFWVSDGWKAGDGPRPEHPEWIRFDFPEPIEASSLTIVPRQGYGPRAGEVQVLSGGGNFEKVAEFSFPPTGEARTVPFPKVRAASYRLLILSAYSFGSAESPWNVQVCEVSFAPPGRRLAGWGVKAARIALGYSIAGPSYVSALEDEEVPSADAEGAIPPVDLVDLHWNLSPDGRLDWDVPQGRWTVLRIGHAPAGYEVKCASPGGEGLEVDWLGSAAMDRHFAATAGKLLEDAGPLAGTTLRYFHDDSWEVGIPNWTDRFLDAFRGSRGYDPRPYLPVLAGRIVGSPDVSDRFLYDYRKTIADCLVRNHYGRFRDLCHRRGVLLHSEGGGPCTVMAPMDALRNLGQNDVPMGEFWHSGHWKRNLQNDVGKQTASAAHTYGKRFVAAEAFTSMGPHWEEAPADLKPTADTAFCEGINRCFLHTSTLSPLEAGTPGQEYFAGTHFNPSITWWEQSPAWLRYLSRCQFLLSEGLPVADACYYYGDHAPNFVAPKDAAAALGPGYDYDVCDADVLLERLRVEDGRIVLPDGVSYRVLVLPDRKTMPLAILRRLKELVEAGATIVGPAPLRSAGLEGYPASDDEVRKLAADLWGPPAGESPTERRFGKGRVIRGRSPREVLQADGVGPDFAHSCAERGASLDWIHRALDGTDIYFVANRLDRAEEVTCSFRVSGRRPELWDPVTGETRVARAFAQAAGRTEVPLRLAPHGSIFVVFREAIGREVAGDRPTNWPSDGPPHGVPGPWSVRFDPARGGPAEAVAFAELGDWTRHADPRVRFYSGAATCATTFDLPPALRGRAGRILLDLGTVKSLARVRLNGEDLGVVWTAPWTVDIARAAKPEGNSLEVEVINLWPNRLIGDQHLEPEKRIATTNVTKFTKDSPLLPSGLLGPVTIRLADD